MRHVYRFRLMLFASVGVLLAFSLLGCTTLGASSGSVSTSSATGQSPPDDAVIDTSSRSEDRSRSAPVRAESTIAVWIADAEASGSDVNLLVIAPADGIRGQEGETGEDPEAWRETRSRELVQSAVGAILRIYGDSQHVRIIDRSQVDLAVGEAQFAASGLASRESQLRLGEFIGASHVYTIELSVESSDEMRREVRTNTLIELATGRVLALDRWLTVAVRDEDGNWYEGRSLNGREYVVTEAGRVYVE